MEIPGSVRSTYCLPHETQLILKAKSKWFSLGHYTVEDLEGTLVFDVKPNKCGRQERRLHDESGQPIVLLKTVKLKNHSWSLSFRERVTAYRGSDENDANKLFTFERSPVKFGTPSYDVFLPTNTNGDSSRPNFVIEGTFWHKKFTVFHNGTTIAKAEKTRSFHLRYLLTIFPGVDRAFISALFIALQTLYENAVRRSTL